MKRLPSMPASSDTSDKMMRVSKSDVQTLIEQEICRTIKKNESKLQGLIETIQQLDGGVDYESYIQNLEARINTVAKRAETAFAYMTKAENKRSPRLDADNITENSRDKNMEPVSQNKNSLGSMDTRGELFQMMESTKTALRKMHSDSEALTAAITELSNCTESPPPVLTPYGSPNKGHVRLIKKEPEVQVKSEDTEELEEPTAKRAKVECFSPGKSNTDPQKRLSYPPLPTTAFPSSLSFKATSYNIPQQPVVHLALIKDPPGLSVLWKVEKEDPSAPPMDSYSIYMTTEKVKGSDVFPSWNIIGEVRAISLPMCVLVNKYKLGHKLCVAVIGKDAFGRYGPYSKVVTASIPD